MKHCLLGSSSLDPIADFVGMVRVATAIGARVITELVVLSVCPSASRTDVDIVVAGVAITRRMLPEGPIRDRIQNAHL